MYKIIGGDGQEYGPVTEQQLRQWIVQGRANEQSMVLREGSDDWQPLSSIPEFAAYLGKPQTPTPTPPAVAQPQTSAQLRPQQSTPSAFPRQYEPIKNYLIPATAITLLCCMPLGAIAVFHASRVNGKIKSGDIEGARMSSGKAKKWCLISFITGVIINLIFILGSIAGIAETYQY